MDVTTQQNAAMVEESTAASQSLAEEANELGRLVSQFRIGQGNERIVSLPVVSDRSDPEQRRAGSRAILKVVGRGRPIA